MTTSLSPALNFLSSLPDIKDAFHGNINKKSALRRLKEANTYLLRTDRDKDCLVLQLKNRDLYHIFVDVESNSIVVGGASAEAGHRYKSFTLFKAYLQKFYPSSLIPVHSPAYSIALSNLALEN